MAELTRPPGAVTPLMDSVGEHPSAIARHSGFFRAFRTEIALAIIASLLLSVWSIYTNPIPNPDAVKYLRAAEYFSAGLWEDGISIFKWPFYSVLIAGVQLLTGLDALYAAHVLNSLLIAALVVGLMSLSHELTNGDAAAVIITAVVFLLHSQFLGIRPVIIRDHGYNFLFVVSIILAIIDIKHPSYLSKFFLLSAIFTAFLFRIEGAYLLVTVFGYYVISRIDGRLSKALFIVFFVLGTSAALPFAFLAWADGSVVGWLYSEAAAPRVSILWTQIAQRVQILEKEVLTYGAGLGWKGYISLVTGLAIFQIIRAITPVYTVLGFISFFPNRLIPRQATLPLIWFAVAQFPLLLLFAFVNAMLEWRYAMSLSLICMFGAVFTITSSWRDLLVMRAGSIFVFPLLAGAMVIAFLIDLPVPKPNYPVHQAAVWIKDNVPSEAHIWTNEPRVAYLAGLRYGDTGGVTEALVMEPTDFEAKGHVDVVVFSAHGGPQLPPRPLESLALVAQFENDADIVSIYSACAEMVKCQAQIR